MTISIEEAILSNKLLSVTETIKNILYTYDKNTKTFKINIFINVMSASQSLFIFKNIYN